MNETSRELTRLLEKQALIANANCILGITIGISISLYIPLYSGSKKTELNLSSGIIGICAFAFSAIKSRYVREFDGKLKMQKDLQKERFIKEQLIAQESYLERIEQQFQQQLEQQFQQQFQQQLEQQFLQTHAEQQTNSNITIDTIPTTKCPHCNSEDTKKNGFDVNQKQRFLCKSCEKSFT
jgi:hypothetical protein